MKFEAVLFDCDGVLVDSELITNGVLRDMLAEQGWHMSLQECMAVFVGKAVMDERARIEAETGKPLTPEKLRRALADASRRLVAAAPRGAAEADRPLPPPAGHHLYPPVEDRTW